MWMTDKSVWDGHEGMGWRAAGVLFCSGGSGSAAAAAAVAATCEGVREGGAVECVAGVRCC